MAYRNGTYIAFHAGGMTDPTASDIRYYRMLKAWHEHDKIEFQFVNSHEKVSAVRDSSTKETLRRSLRERLNSSRNMVYVLAVKNNQPGLLRDAKAAIAAAERNKAKQASTKDTGHGRKDTRTAIVAPVRDMAEKHNFPGLKAVARIASKRGRDKTVQRYFLMTQRYTPAELLRIVREHWGIENALHWTLDVVLDEDQTRSRKDHAPANLAVLRRLALNIARAHPDTKTPLRGKLKRAAWDDSFLVDMLLNMR